MCVLLWFHCFRTEIDMKSIKIYSWSHEKLCVLNSFDRVVFICVFPSRFGIQFASFALLCCDGFIWADLFTCFHSSRSLSCGPIKYAHIRFIQPYIQPNSRTTSKHLCWCFDVAIFTFSDSFCVLLLLFFSLDLFFGLFPLLLLVGFRGCCCSNAGADADAAGVLFLLHTDTISAYNVHGLLCFENIFCVCVQGNPMWDSFHFIWFHIQFLNWVWECMALCGRCCCCINKTANTDFVLCSCCLG